MKHVFFGKSNRPCKVVLGKKRIGGFTPIPTARSYVQDGLIFQLDGIENAGFGIHDASAATWKDLKGSDDLTMTSNGVWSDNGIDNFATGYRIAYRSSFTFDAPLTQEVVFHVKSSQTTYNNVMFHIAQWHNGNSMLRGINWRIPTNTFNLKSALPSYGVIASNSSMAIASVYDSSGVFAAYKNGEGVSLAYGSDDWYYSDASGVNLGNRSTNDRGTFIKFFAIRFYNRVLTETELAANYAVDKARFNLP